MPNRSTEGRLRWLARLAEFVLAVVVVALGWTCGFVYVEGSSMEPTLSAGDVVVYVRQVGTLAEGDIALFDHDGSLVVHRVIATEGDGSLRTRGDANASADSSAVSRGQVRGKAVLVVPIGGFVRMLAAEVD